MSANAQRDGCPAEYRWRRKVWLMPTTRVPFGRIGHVAKIGGPPTSWGEGSWVPV